MHRDTRGRNIEREGFYLDTGSGKIVYFNGKYEGGNPVFEDSSKHESPYTRTITSQLVRISNPKDHIKSLNEDINWAKQKISGLETSASDQHDLAKEAYEEGPDWLRNKETSPTFLEKCFGLQTSGEMES